MKDQLLIYPHFMANREKMETERLYFLWLQNYCKQVKDQLLIYPYFMANREKMETVTDFIFLGSKIIVNVDCSHEIKRYLLLRRKAMTNLDSVLKSRDITLPTKVCIVSAVVSPIVTYRCESGP